MQFAERMRWRLLTAALCLAAAGCATPPPSPEVEPASSTTAAAPTAGPPTAAPAPGVEVSAQTRLAFERAVAALAAGRQDEAEQEFTALTKSNPELGGPHANLGLIYRRAGKLEQAATQLELAVQASPQQAVYFNQLGIAYRELGRMADAQRAYEKAIELAPDYPAPWLNLGILLDLYLWDGRGALAAYERYLALAGDGDQKVRKWAAEIRNRKGPAQLAGVKERP